MAAYVLWVLAAFSAFTVLRYSLKGERKLASLFYMSAPGFIALALINFSSRVTGIGIPVNIYNLAVSAFLGLPGVIGLAVSGLIR